MTLTEKNIVDNYLALFESLNSVTKIELINRLKKSIPIESKTNEDDFYKSFGAFSSEKTSDEINAEIKTSRKFKNREIKF